jgi:DNA-binding MarR family transcriptional regulator
MLEAGGDQRAHQERNAALTQAIGALSGQSVLFSQTVAQRLGMHPSDLECLGFLADQESVSAGRLSEVTGLTTGAVTRLIDRLERAGYVRRLADSTDRRRVLVEPIAERVQVISRQYLALQDAFEATFAAYTAEQLDLVLEFLRRTEAAMSAARYNPPHTTP